jgi:hypothetical protein
VARASIRITGAEVELMMFQFAAVTGERESEVSNYLSSQGQSCRGKEKVVVSHGSALGRRKIISCPGFVRDGGSAGSALRRRLAVDLRYKAQSSRGTVVHSRGNLTQYNRCMLDAPRCD